MKNSLEYIMNRLVELTPVVVTAMRVVMVSVGRVMVMTDVVMNDSSDV